MAVAVVAAVVGANVIAHAHDAQADLSANRRFSLAPDSKALARAVRAPLRITAFLNAGGPAARDARFLLARYQELNRRISYRVVDPDTNPGEAARFGVTQYSTVVLTYHGRRVDAPDAQEPEISTAVLRLLRASSPTVCVLIGHGEPQLSDTSPVGLSKTAQLLKDNAYQVKTVDLAMSGAQVPSDCTAVLEIAPVDALLPNEQAAVLAYERASGKLLLAASPLTRGDPNPLTSPWGVRVVGGLAVDPDHSVNLDVSDVIVGSFPSVNPVDTGVNRLQYPAGGGLLVESRPRGGLTISKLAVAGPGSYIATHPDTGLSFDSTSIAGPVLVAAAADESHLTTGGGGGGAGVARTRLLVIGGDGWMVNQFLDNLSNRRFLVNGLAWLTEQDQLVTATERPAQVRQLPFTSADQSKVLAVGVGLVPGAIVLAGIVPAVIGRRRRRA